ncbi:MAG: sugar phosphate isomerase/epimerase [Gemmatimonadaceae bacterium]
MNRRTFLFELAAIGAGTSAFAACAGAKAGTVATPATGAAANAGASAVGGAPASTKVIGLQMYTVRDLLEKDFEGTVEKVAQVGYKNLEFAGYANRRPEQIRALLDRLGLVSTSAHIGAQLMRPDPAGQIKSATVIGQDYITIPSYNFGREGVAGWKKGVAEFNTWGKMCKDAGIKLAYHNHAAEFAPIEGAPNGYDVLVREVDPALVDFELDLYWAAFASQDPHALFAKYPGRFAMWHVKDLLLTNGTKGMTPVGKGMIDFKSIFAHAPQAGLKHFFVEHDSAATYPGGSLASIQASHDYLKQLLA